MPARIDERMRLIPVALLLTSVLGSTGCVFNHGARLHQMTEPTAAVGVNVDVRLRTGLLPGRLSGELLEVDDSAVLIVNDHVWRLPRRDIIGIQQTERSLRLGSAGLNASRDRVPHGMRLLARFPWGLPDGVLEEILARYRQIAPHAPSVSPSRTRKTSQRDHRPAPLAATDAFLRDARDATARYRMRAAAIADGYRRIGPAFPGMGEHWVHPGLIVSGTVDPRRPPVLCYADSAGTPTLVGLAFAVPLRTGQHPPETPMGPTIWHEHGDAVDAESLLLVHRASGDDAAPRLAMFHAWIWLDNPDGVFAQNNWAIPFAQLGLDARSPTAAAAQALALLTVGDDFYLRIFDHLITAQPDQRSIMQTALLTAAARVHEWHASRTSTTLLADDVQALEEIWSHLWTLIDERVNDRTRAQLRQFPGRADRPLR